MNRFAPVVIAGALIAPLSRAAEQTVGPRGPARWAGRDLTFEIVIPPGSSSAEAASVMQSAEVAARSWDSTCSAIRIEVVPQRHGVHAASPDGRSTVTFLSQVWCRAGQPTRGCHRANELAATTMFFSVARSEVRESLIAEADIEVNAVRFEWPGARSERSEREKTPAPVALSSVLAHEMGHALGLDDACRSAPGECPVPPPSIMTAVAHDGRGERAPTTQDLATICSLYPLAPGAGARGTPTSAPATGDASAWAGSGAAGAGLVILGMIGARLSRRRTGREDQRAGYREKAAKR